MYVVSAFLQPSLAHEDIATFQFLPLLVVAPFSYMYTQTLDPWYIAQCLLHLLISYR